MTVTKWRVCVPSHGETFEDGFDVDAYEDDGPRAVAKLGADSFWSTGGYEVSWPVVFRLRSPKGEVFDIEVEMELIPQFWAR